MRQIILALFFIALSSCNEITKPKPVPVTVIAPESKPFEINDSDVIAPKSKPSYFETNDSAFGKKSYSKCDAISTFLNSKDVISGFKFPYLNKDSLLIILDLFNELSECYITKWRGFPVSIINKGPLIDSLKKFNWHYVIKHRTNMYVFASHQVGDIGRSITIQNGSSNVGCSIQIREKNKRFYLGKIKSYVE